ncbi:MAG TPA: mechanosensitive ion channel family protein [Tepidisphaeraceae bacterium]|nr:mechanosensitive ion channel family protein [Tepidisphaeraceae bacterium]
MSEDLLITRILDPNRGLGALFYGVALLAAAMLVSRIIKWWCKRLSKHHAIFVDRTTISFMSGFLRLAVFLLAATFYASLVPPLQRVGTALLASASILSLVLGLAAQNTLGNLISGIALLLYRPFAIGDSIVFNTPMGKETGTVQQLTLGYTKLQTEDGRLVVIPNSVMISSVIIKLNPSGETPLPPPGAGSQTF